MIRVAIGCFAALALLSSSLAQQKLVDARTAIREIRANDPETKIENAERALTEHLRVFADHCSEPYPGQAAEWLSLVDEAIALPHRSFNGMMAGAMAGPAGS